MNYQFPVIVNHVVQLVVEQTRGAPRPSGVTPAGVQHHKLCTCDQCTGTPSPPDVFELTSEPSTREVSAPAGMPQPRSVRLPFLVVSRHEALSGASAKKSRLSDVEDLRALLVRRLAEWAGGLVVYDDTSATVTSVDLSLAGALTNALCRADERYPGFGAWRLTGDQKLLSEHITALAWGLRLHGIEPEFSVSGGWNLSRTARGNVDRVAHQLRSFGLIAGVDICSHLE